MGQTSKITQFASTCQEWILENWAQSHEILATGNVGCVVDVGVLRVRFYLQKKEEWDNYERTGTMDYSLCIEILEEQNLNIVLELVATVPLTVGSITGRGLRNLSGLKTGRKEVIIGKFLTISKTKRAENGSKCLVEHPSGSKSHYLMGMQNITIQLSVSLFGYRNKKNEPIFKKQEDVEREEVEMIRQLKNLYMANETFSDLKIIAKDNVVLSAHKFQIAARSETFLTLIEEAVKQSDFDGTMQISDVNSKPLEVILHWMYTGELHEDAGNVMEEVVEAAGKYKLDDLLKILDTRIVEVCTADNMFNLYEIAKENTMNTAVNDIKDFIKASL